MCAKCALDQIRGYLLTILRAYQAHIGSIFGAYIAHIESTYSACYFYRWTGEKKSNAVQKETLNRLHVSRATYLGRKTRRVRLGDVSRTSQS